MVESVLNNVKSSQSITTVDVRDAATLSEQAFKEQFVAKNKPCLIKGAIKHWPALTKWHDKEYLIERVGKQKVDLYPHMNYEEAERFQIGEMNKTLTEAIGMLSSDNITTLSVPSLLLEDDPMFKSNTVPLAALKADVLSFPFLKKASPPIAYPASRAYMYKGAGTSWHYHFTDETLMCQVKGTKRVGLLPPDSKTYNIVYKTFIGSNDAYLEDPDCLTQEQKEQLQLSITDIEEGDALYIPSFWWHGIETIDNDFGITVAQCWRTPLNVIGNLSYPVVRSMWKKAIKTPSKRSFYIMGYGVLSLLSQMYYFLFKSR